MTGRGTQSFQPGGISFQPGGISPPVSAGVYFVSAGGYFTPQLKKNGGHDRFSRGVLHPSPRSTPRPAPFTLTQTNLKLLSGYHRTTASLCSHAARRVSPKLQTSNRPSCSWDFQEMGCRVGTFHRTFRRFVVQSSETCESQTPRNNISTLRTESLRNQRGSSLIRNSAPLGPYGRNKPRALWWS